MSSLHDEFVICWLYSLLIHYTIFLPYSYIYEFLFTKLLNYNPIKIYYLREKWIQNIIFYLIGLHFICSKIFHWSYTIKNIDKAAQSLY